MVAAHSVKERENCARSVCARGWGAHRSARAHAVDIDVNYQMAPRTTKWYLYGWMFQTVVRLGISGSDHATDFAHDQGSTALHLASKRGNLGQVIYLLEHGAQDSLWAKNAMGHTPCVVAAAAFSLFLVCVRVYRSALSRVLRARARALAGSRSRACSARTRRSRPRSLPPCSPPRICRRAGGGAARDGGAPRTIVRPHRDEELL